MASAEIIELDAADSNPNPALSSSPPLPPRKRRLPPSPARSSSRPRSRSRSPSGRRSPRCSDGKRWRHKPPLHSLPWLPPKSPTSTPPTPTPTPPSRRRLRSRRASAAYPLPYPARSSSRSRSRSLSGRRSPRCSDGKRWRYNALTVEVCRDFLCDRSTRPEIECKYAHPHHSVSVERDNKVTACADSLRKNCFRGRTCPYYHPPPHIQEYELFPQTTLHFLLKDMGMGDPLIMCNSSTNGSMRGRRGKFGLRILSMLPFTLGTGNAIILVAKVVDGLLQAQGGNRLVPVGLGDDDQCIEDYFTA